LLKVIIVTGRWARRWGIHGLLLGLQKAMLWWRIWRWSRKKTHIKLTLVLELLGVYVRMVVLARGPKPVAHSRETTSSFSLFSWVKRLVFVRHDRKD
jgi:hypothetical protein